MSSAKGTLFLLGAALVWGLAFPAQSVASSSVAPFTFIAAKSSIAAIFLGCILLIRLPRRSSDRQKRQEEIIGPPSYTARAIIIGGIACGIALCIADNFQQAGITAYPSDTAAAGRAGFLTATYVIMVALFSLFTKKKPHPATLIAAGVCLLGMYFLCVSKGLNNIYVGDILILGSALGYAVHILVIDHYAALDGIKVSCVQFITSAALSLCCALIFEHPTLDQLSTAFLPILYVGAISSGIGYTFQNLGQKSVAPSIAAIVMSLESVFAALGGWLLLGEMLTGREFFGCVLVFAAVLLAQTPALLTRKDDGAHLSQAP